MPWACLFWINAQKDVLVVQVKTCSLSGSQESEGNGVDIPSRESGPSERG